MRIEETINQIKETKKITERVRKVKKRNLYYKCKNPLLFDKLEKIAMEINKLTDIVKIIYVCSLEQIRVLDEVFGYDFIITKKLPSPNEFVSEPEDNGIIIIENNNNKRGRIMFIPDYDKVDGMEVRVVLNNRFKIIEIY